MNIAHIFWSDVPHIAVNVIPFLEPFQRTSYYYIWNRKGDSIDQIETTNNCWLKKIKDKQYKGILQQASWVNRKFNLRYTKSILWLFIPELSFSSLVKIYRGPKRFVFHGGFLSLPTMIALRLMGKEVIGIHFGGKKSCESLVAKISALGLRLYRHIYVLMTPELRYFSPFVCADKLSLLTYPATRKLMGVSLMGYQMSSDLRSRIALFGNSTWSRDDYDRVMEKINGGDWDKIICMLNYGDDNHAAKTDAFIKRQALRFGDKFYAWQNVLPYEEYIQIVASAMIYISPIRTQSGLGAIYYGIMQGKTVFLAGDNFEWIKSLGIKVYNIDDMTDFSRASFDRCLLSHEEQLKNVQALKRYFSEVATLSNWQQKICG